MYLVLNFIKKIVYEFQYLPIIIIWKKFHLPRHLKAKIEPPSSF